MKKKKTIVEGYVNSFLSSFKENKWSRYEESGMQYMHHPTVKPKMILYDFNNTVIPFVYDGSDAEYSEFSKSRGIWVERRNKFYKDYSQDENLKWNFHSLTIYPSGEYESSFIWDNEAHLDYLVKSMQYWLKASFEKAGERIADRCNQLNIEWNFDVTVVISFTSGKSDPVLFTPSNSDLSTFVLYLEQLWEWIEGNYSKAFEEWGKLRLTDSSKIGLVLEDEYAYNSINYGELKERFTHWNKATLTINPNNFICFEDIKFEWLPENEV